MKTNTQDGRPPIPPPLCPTQNKTGKCVEQLTQAKYKSKVRGERSDLASHPPPSCIQEFRIGPGQRVCKNSFFSWNLASCRDIKKNHFILFSKLAEV